ncbi:MAG TPA: hypothetical protein VM324_15705 [Egibacteraceae bacterium]|nr:hypothetical protein [Egibacteraceae bacterium]
MTRSVVDSDTTSAQAKPPNGPPRHRRGVRLPDGLRVALVGLVSLAVGVGLTVLVTEALRGTRTPVGEVTPVADLPIGQPPEVESFSGPTPPGQPADTPEAAVRAFLDAEVAGDYAASYLLLAAGDRGEYRTAAGWVALHADVLPPVTGYEVEQATVGDGRAAVVALVGFEPSLDHVIGLVPGRARATWSVVAEDGGWAVALQESTFEPLHPPDGEAGEAVREWALSRQECRSGGEHSSVLGQPALARELCGSDGAVEVGPVEPFREGFDTNGILAAYGEPVLEWARVVPVIAPIELRVVVAPVGRQWRVIGVLQSRTPR